MPPEPARIGANRACAHQLPRLRLSPWLLQPPRRRLFQLLALVHRQQQQQQQLMQPQLCCICTQTHAAAEHLTRRMRQSILPQIQRLVQREQQHRPPVKRRGTYPLRGAQRKQQAPRLQRRRLLLQAQ